jgi:hypothetical protein
VIKCGVEYIQDAKEDECKPDHRAEARLFIVITIIHVFKIARKFKNENTLLPADHKCRHNFS